MKTTVTPFTTLYTQWLDAFRANFPGGSSAIPSEVPAPQQELVVAKQEWEDEGGSVKLEAKPRKAKAKSKPGAKSKPKPKAKQARKKRR